MCALLGSGAWQPMSWPALDWPEGWSLVQSLQSGVSGGHVGCNGWRILVYIVCTVAMLALGALRRNLSMPELFLDLQLADPCNRNECSGTACHVVQVVRRDACMILLQP